MEYAAGQDEHFDRFIRKWKKKKTYGWAFFKWLTLTLFLGALFFISVWGTTQQTGLMPGGSIGGKAKQLIGNGALEQIK